MVAAWVISMFISSLSTECITGIQEYDEEDYETLVAEPSRIRGYYAYILPCGGIVTSVEARGFCGRPDNVELRLLSAARADHSFSNVHDIVFLDAKCNKTAKVDENYYEGYVSATGLNIQVPPGNVLAVNLNPDCSSKCYFQPAVINKTMDSNYEVVFGDSYFVWSPTNTSLFFSANITSETFY